MALVTLTSLFLFDISWFKTVSRYLWGKGLSICYYYFARNYDSAHNDKLFAQISGYITSAIDIVLFEKMSAK